ncbi:unnamed protein product [Arctia plantaginis]|uniref:Uncharacterized protein n=1 Tax=Arctia plantaginis TaxID=874455 RepID=A0A8S1BNU5_ARCPL|nr:unnamed protein product [Arctia plantaginis]
MSLILLGFSLDFFKICFIIYRLLKDKSLNEAIIFWFGEGLVYVLTMCIPLVLMELAFNDLDDINTILADELLTYKAHETLARAKEGKKTDRETCHWTEKGWNNIQTKSKQIFVSPPEHQRVTRSRRK